MPSPEDHRRQLQEMLRGYRLSQVLIACAELGVFAELGDETVSAEVLARRLRVDGPALARLLNAAVALGLLEKPGEAYRNSPLARDCLVAEGPYYLGHLVRREGVFYRRWAHLAEAARTGRRPPANAQDEAPSDWVRNFELALYDVARTAAPVVAEALGPLLPRPAGRPLRAIDIGGGHGAYSIALARRYAGLEAIVFELPAAAAVAREIVAAADMGQRVRVQAGDFKADDLGTGFDLALLFGVLVSEPPAEALTLLRKTAAALVPGGLVALRGFYLAPERTGPLDATLFDLHMLLSTDAGAAHTVEQLLAWLATAGFQPPEMLPLPAPERSSLIVARKPLT